MNVFSQDYYSLLKSWYDLKENLSNQNLKTICVEVDKFWQQCPLVNYYLHPDFIQDWPDPWQLLNDNSYCSYARALGMIYTLWFLNIKTIELVEASDSDNNQVVLVLVDEKYILNYWPNTVTQNQISDFVIRKTLNVTFLHDKII